MALILMSAGKTQPVHAATAPTLVDFAGTTAVFERDGELFQVRQHERIADSDVRLIHVGPDSVLVELPGRGQSELKRIVMRRGARIVEDSISIDRESTALAVTAIEAPRANAANAAAKGN